MSVPLTDADDWLSEQGFVGSGVSGRFALTFRGGYEGRAYQLEYVTLGVWNALHFPVVKGERIGMGSTPLTAILDLLF